MPFLSVVEETLLDAVVVSVEFEESSVVLLSVDDDSSVVVSFVLIDTVEVVDSEVPFMFCRLSLGPPELESVDVTVVDTSSVVLESSSVILSSMKSRAFISRGVYGDVPSSS